MATHAIPSIKDVYNGIISDYQTRVGLQEPLMRQALIKMITWPIAAVVVMSYRASAQNYLEMFVSVCSFEALRQWGAKIGVDWKPGTYGVIEATYTGVAAVNIGAGTIISTETGGLYKTTADTPVISGTAILTATAVDPGVQNNAQLTDTSSMVNPLPGVPDEGVVSKIVEEGGEAETVGEYRARVTTAYRIRGAGGSPADYYLWSTEISGVVDILYYVINLGVTTVYPIMVGSGADRVPSSAKRNEVLESIRKSPNSDIYDRLPGQAAISILSLTLKPYDMVIIGMSSSANTNSNRSAIKAALINYLDGRKPEIPALGYSAFKATIGDTEASSAAYNVIQNSSNPGTFTDLEVYTGGVLIVGSDTLGIGELAVLGTLTINGVEVV